MYQIMELLYLIDKMDNLSIVKVIMIIIVFLKHFFMIFILFYGNFMYRLIIVIFREFSVKILKIIYYLQIIYLNC